MLLHPLGNLSLVIIYCLVQDKLKGAIILKNPWINGLLEQMQVGLFIIYKSGTIVQKGFSIMAGATVGHVQNLNKKWSLEYYVSGGNSQDFYKGYRKSEGTRYDLAKNFNRSGEWIPFGGGINIGYRF